MNKSLLENNAFMELIKPTDPPEYQPNRFGAIRSGKFKLVIVTKNKFPADELIEQTYPIRIVLPGDSF